MLIVNADDWGRDRATTEAIAACVARGSVSSVSAMVFMEDSERAASMARERGVDAGLHLNYTTAFTRSNCSPLVVEQQRRLAAYLGRHRLAQIVFNPLLARVFGDVTSAQIDEYRRLYGTEPRRLDGHHHMHLCANVLCSGLLPRGTVVRPHFTFRRGEKGIVNRAYRRVGGAVLTRRHPTVDHLFSLAPIDRERLRRIFALSRDHRVEVETHPIQPDEYRFLVDGEIFRWAAHERVTAARSAWNPAYQHAH